MGHDDAAADSASGGRVAVTLPDPAVVDRPWLRGWPVGVPTAFDLPDVVVDRLLTDAARDFPGRVALEADTSRWTYDELNEVVDRLADDLDARGVEAGMYVLVVLPTSPALAAVAFAVWRVGAVLVLADAADRGQAADAYVGTDPDLVIADPEVAANVGFARERTLVIDAPAWTHEPRRARSRRGGRDRRRTSIDPPATIPAVPAELRREHRGWGAPRAGVRDEVAAVLWAPAIGGRDRAVLLTHGNLLAAALQVRLWLPDLRAGHERVLVAIPPSHPFGLSAGLLASVLQAAAQVFVDEDGVADEVASGDCTFFPALPRHVDAVVARGTEVTTLRTCLVGGRLDHGLAASSGEVFGATELLAGLALPEAGGLVTADPIPAPGEAASAHGGRIGRPLPDTVAVTVDPATGAPVTRPGSPGWLAVAGPQVSPGYLGGPGGTTDVHVGDWLVTRHVVTEEDGTFTLVASPGDRHTDKDAG